MGTGGNFRCINVVGTNLMFGHDAIIVGLHESELKKIIKFHMTYCCGLEVWEEKNWKSLSESFIIGSVRIIFL